jgi:hypothetical protein
MFGWLDNFSWWVNLPYPIKGSLLRAMKSGLSVAVGVLVAAAAAGTLFPVGFSPLIVLIVTALLQSIDKYLRENAIAKAADSQG